MKKSASKVVPENAKQEKVLTDGAILVEAESLSRKDKFLKYRPKTAKEKRTKALILEAIKSGVKNFYRPFCDPSITEDDRIQFVAGQKPLIDKTYEWWIKAAKEYNPERNSRLGTRLEYGAFLGVLIKKLVEEGNPIEWAWLTVCWDSESLGHYWNSVEAKHTFELTGSRGIFGFCDLANTTKVLVGEDDGLWNVSGSCFALSYVMPISYMAYEKFYREAYGSVGWVVMS